MMKCNATDKNVMMNTLPWWKNGVIYQIYPKSFQDSTGSGSGDLNGVIRRLDYLRELGVSALWLTPVYPSPQVDNGYDVADYCAIDPAYGTMDDFARLVAQAHRRDIRIVMDMVFNHTSTRHPWFEAAQDAGSDKHAYYVWRDGAEGAPPNNWRAKFGGGAWQWSERAGKYYLHLFSAEQADLNWEHPPVRDELKRVCQFWADRGVDGLRLDVVNLVSKRQDFPDDEDGDGRRFYTDGPRIHAFLHEFSRDVFRPNRLMTVGEMSSTTLDHCRRYGALDGSELSMTFNFHHLKVDYPDGEKWTRAAPDFVELKRIFSHWQRGMHNRAWNALFWCNHDQPRIVSRFGDTGALRTVSAKMLAMVLHGMQGTPYLYQGEEIGMTNPGFTRIGQYRDVESLNMFAERRAQGDDEDELLAILADKSRDNSRTPMQWDDGPNAGFSSGAPWIDLAANYREINVRSALAAPDSVFHCYRRLIALRRELPLLTHGDYQDLLPDHPWLWCYCRRHGERRLLVLANLGAQPRSLEDLAVPAPGRTLLGNYPRGDEPPRRLRPYEAVYWLV